MTKIRTVLLLVVAVVIGISFGFRHIQSDSSSVKLKNSVSAKPDSASALPEWEQVYHSLGLKKQGLSEVAFRCAWAGFTQLKFKNPVMAIADFSQSSKNKRLYVIDFLHKKLLMNTYVAHGRNSGEEFAKIFSNKNSSYQSSLGFYRTLGTYQGKHGLSLRLEGLEKGINDQAYARAIVMHGAEYVSESFIRNTGRLGRSQGCPAVSMAEHKNLIRLLHNDGGLFIYSPDNKYLSASGMLAGVTNLLPRATVGDISLN